MKKFKVRSGELNKTVWAISQEKAMKKAIKRHSRKLGRRLGHYISVVENGKDELSDASFFLTDDVLKKVEFRNCERMNVLSLFDGMSGRLML